MQSNNQLFYFFFSLNELAGLFLCWQICYLFSSIAKPQIYFCLEAAEKDCHAIHRYNYESFKTFFVTHQQLFKNP